MAYSSEMTCLCLRVTTVVLIVLSTSHGILQEYYLDSEDQYNDNSTDVSNGENLNEVLVQVNNDTSMFTLNRYETKQTNNSDLRRVETHFTQITTTSSDTLSSKTNVSLNVTGYKNILRILKNISYDYADDETPLHPLRSNNETNESVVNTTEIIFTGFLEDDHNITHNNSIKYIADFFNLDPASSKLEIKDTMVKKYRGSAYTWYVPEKYPCWDLPVVVGRLGKRKIVSDVFRVYYGRLTDVLPVGKPQGHNPIRYQVPNHRKRSNKWCNNAPCFGDHSLCIFTEKSLSKICDVGYKVTIPSKLEKISIIHTINSMRNSLASGLAENYRHLPRAADMKQMLYDSDLEEMAEAWLRQCLPGIDPCSSLDNEYVTQLECTKSADHCCTQVGGDIDAQCIPKYECFIYPVVGCLHAWFASAGQKLTKTDVGCGHANPETFSTVQLIWSKTVEIGCAYGERTNGDIRIVCNFAPGAPFFLSSKYYCGLLDHKEITNVLILNNDTEVTDLKFLSSLGIILNEVHSINDDETLHKSRAKRTSDLEGLNVIYQPGWAREAKKEFGNGTMGMVARLVTEYTFIEEGMSKCDLDEPVYRIGEPGSMCIEKGRRYGSLCFDFAETNPGYRLTAIVAPIALFSLILYDLFSGVMRQTNY